MGRRGWRIGGLILLVLVVGSIGLVWLALREQARLLLDIARPVRSGNLLGHAWQSDQILLTFTPGEKQACLVKAVDVAAGTDQDKATFHRSEGATDLWSVSPDGRQLAVGGYTKEDYGAEGVDVFDLTSTQSVSLAGYLVYNPQAGVPPSIAWLPDSRRLLTMQKGEISLYSIDTPDATGVSVPVPKGARALLGVTPDLRLITTDFVLTPGSNTRKIVIYSTGLLPNTDAERQYTITLPSDMEAHELMLSPHGDRLAWTLAFSRIHPLRKLLARLIPALAKNTQPERGTALWVSRLDGHEMHQIGFQPAGTDKKSNEAPHDLHWQTDGKHLSFLYTDNIYTVPAD